MFFATTARTLCLVLAAFGAPTRPAPSAPTSLALVSADVREGDDIWLPAPQPRAVAWNTPVRFEIASPDHAHEVRVVPRLDGFLLDYTRDGQPVLEHVVVPAGASLVQPSDLGIALRVRITAIDP